MNVQLIQIISTVSFVFDDLGDKGERLMHLFKQLLFHWNLKLPKNRQRVPDRKRSNYIPSIQRNKFQISINRKGSKISILAYIDIGDAISMNLLVPINFQLLIDAQNLFIDPLSPFELIFSYLLLNLLLNWSLDVHCWLEEGAFSKIFTHNFVCIENDYLSPPIADSHWR